MNEKLSSNDIDRPTNPQVAYVYTLLCEIIKKAAPEGFEASQARMAGRAIDLYGPELYDDIWIRAGEWNEAVMVSKESGVIGEVEFNSSQTGNGLSYSIYSDGAMSYREEYSGSCSVGDRWAETYRVGVLHAALQSILKAVPELLEYGEPVSSDIIQ